MTGYCRIMLHQRVSGSSATKMVIRLLVLWSLFTLANCLQPLTNILGNYGEMTPKDPLIATGNTLVVNCTLTNYSGPFNITDMYFSFGGNRIPSSYVTVLDESSAQLQYPNMTRNMSQKHMFCYMPGLDVLIRQQTVSDAEMIPNDPPDSSGSTLVVNCSLANYSGTYKVNDMYFMLGGERLPSAYVSELDVKTAQLRLPNMSDNMNQESIFCYMPGPRVLIGQQAVHVADLPVKPVITECRVYNWISMTCTWEPERQDTGLQTTQQLYWTLLLFQANPSWYHCPIQRSNHSCEWKLDDGQNSFHFGYTYAVVIAATNELQRVFSNLIYMHTRLKVQPDPVGNLMVPENGNFTSTSAMVTWTSPNSRKDILFQVNCTAITPNGTLLEHTRKIWRVSGKGSEFSVHMTDLLIFTEYNVSVQARPLVEHEESGYWSEMRSYIFKTKEDVPAANPEIIPGSFYSTERGAEFRKVYVYWKLLPQHLRNGPITKYMINFTSPLEPLENMNLRTPGDDFYGHQTLHKKLNYTVHIVAYTSVGCNTSLAPSQLFIPSEDQAPNPPSDFLVLALSDVNILFNWTVGERTLSHTLFWCPGTLTNWECRGDLDWMKLAGNETSYNLTLPTGTKYTEYIFAISVEAVVMPSDSSRVKRAVPMVASSGLKWNDCVYDTLSMPAKPVGYQLSSHQEGESISIEWRLPLCAQTGYIEFFTIFYCIKSNCEETTKQINVSGRTTSYVVTDLQGDAEYSVWMWSVSPYHADPSQSVDRIAYRVTVSGLRNGEIAGVVFGCLFVLFFMGLGIFTVIRNIRKKAKEKFDIPIDMPSAAGYLPHNDHENHYEDGSALPRYMEYAHNGNLEDSPLVGNDSSAPSRIWENVENQNREQFETGRNHKDVAYMAVPDQEGHIYMNGDIRSHGLAIQFKCPSRDSGTGSVSSTDTVTTPLPSDTSLDADDVFVSKSLNRQHQPGMTKALMPVPEESSGGTATHSAEGATGNDAEQEYYNIDDSSDLEDTISSYNPVGMADDSLDKEKFMRMLRPVENTPYHALDAGEDGDDRLPASWRTHGPQQPEAENTSAESPLESYSTVDELSPEHMRCRAPSGDYMSTSLPALDAIPDAAEACLHNDLSSSSSELLAAGQAPMVDGAGIGAYSCMAAASLPSLEVMQQLLQQGAAPQLAPVIDTPSEYVAHTDMPVTSTPLPSPTGYVSQPPPVRPAPIAKPQPKGAAKMPGPSAQSPQSFALPVRSGMSGGTMMVAPSINRPQPVIKPSVRHKPRVPKFLQRSNQASPPHRNCFPNSSYVPATSVALPSHAQDSVVPSQAIPKPPQPTRTSASHSSQPSANRDRQASPAPYVDASSLHNISRPKGVPAQDRPQPVGAESQSPATSHDAKPQGSGMTPADREVPSPVGYLDNNIPSYSPPSSLPKCQTSTDYITLPPLDKDNNTRQGASSGDYLLHSDLATTLPPCEQASHQEGQGEPNHCTDGGESLSSSAGSTIPSVPSSGSPQSLGAPQRRYQAAGSSALPPDTSGYIEHDAVLPSGYVAADSIPTSCSAAMASNNNDYVKGMPLLAGHTHRVNET